MNSAEKIIQLWTDDIRSGLPLRKTVTPNNNEVLSAPATRIENFSEELLMNLLCLMHSEEAGYNLCKKRWLEKVRRYFEINKSKLWDISCRRFGAGESAQSTLERMLCFLAAYTYFSQDIKLYSATCNAYDILKTKVPSNRWQIGGAEEFIENVVSNPQRYVGADYGK